jgi:hypothetical protein
LDHLSRINSNYERLWQQPTRKSAGNSKAGGGGLEAWGWYVTLDNLSNGCPEKWEYYYDMKLIEFLNLLLYYKDKEEYYEKLRQLNDFKARR